MPSSSCIVLGAIMLPLEQIWYTKRSLERLDEATIKQICKLPR